jgi:AraC family transcriptional regulator
VAKTKPLLIDASKKQNSLMNSAVTLSDNKVSWPMIHVSHHQFLAAVETPEHCFAQHFISVHLSPIDVIKEQKLNGRPQYSNFNQGDICLTPATVPVSVRLQAPSEIVGLSIEPAFLNQLTTEVSKSDRLELVPQFKLKDPMIYQMAIALEAQVSSPGEYNCLYIESIATALSVHLLQYYSTRNPSVKTYNAGLSKARLGQVLEFIHEHSNQNLSLIEMAQQVHMSPYHFSRLFKQSTGLSPHLYLINRRNQKAKRLLETTTLSIAEIAAQAGFADQSHFARHFKRQYGMPPSQIR